jgi:hypothetical protein
MIATHCRNKLVGVGRRPPPLLVGWRRLSWIMVTVHTPLWLSSISYVRRVCGSAELAASKSGCQVCTSFRGGSLSMTWPTIISSGIPIAFISTLARAAASLQFVFYAAAITILLGPFRQSDRIPNRLSACIDHNAVELSCGRFVHSHRRPFSELALIANIGEPCLNSACGFVGVPHHHINRDSVGCCVGLDLFGRHSWGNDWVAVNTGEIGRPIRKFRPRNVKYFTQAKSQMESSFSE